MKAKEEIGKLDSERCNEQGHPLVMAVCMCYVRRENVEAREKELKAPMSQAEVDAAIASSGELYEAGRKSGIAWAQAEIAELKSQVTTLHLENLEYGQRIAMDAVKIEKLRAGAEPGENVSETKNSAP